MVQPHDELCLREKIIASNGVVQGEPERAFRILMANFSKKPKPLAKGQTVGTLLPHPTAIFNTPVALAQVLHLDKVDNPVEVEKNEALSETDKENPKRENKSPKPSRMWTSTRSPSQSKVDTRYAAQVCAYVGWSAR